MPVRPEDLIVPNGPGVTVPVGSGPRVWGRNQASGECFRGMTRRTVDVMPGNAKIAIVGAGHRGGDARVRLPDPGAGKIIATSLAGSGNREVGLRCRRFYRQRECASLIRG
jgi:hypothetical protein